jgi:hypothetical protein
LLRSSREVPETTRSGLGAVFMSDIWQFAAVFPASGGGEDFLFGGLSFYGESPKSDLRWLCLALAAF